MTSDPFHPILLTTFSWLSEEEAAEVAQGLAATVDTSLSVRAQMEVFARTLDEMGLRVTAPLLMELTGRGSKTSAVEVVRETSRARFEQCRQARLAPLDAPAVAPVVAAISQADLISAMQACLSQIPLPAAPAAAVTIPEALQVDIRQIAGNVNWLKSMIDTERQLRRYVDRHGPLEEPRPRIDTQTEEGRRTVINQVTAHLAQTNFREGSSPAQPPRPAPRLSDAACEGGEGMLDL